MTDIELSGYTSGYIYLPINPDPWAIGPLGVGKRGGKYFPYVGRNNQLDAFKKAVVEELRSQEVQPVDAESYRLDFWFWRRLDGSADRRKKHVADTTNLQKALEDALQGVLIGNDRDVLKISSETRAQGPDVKPCIVLRVTDWTMFPRDPHEIPESIMMKVRAPEVVEKSDNVWRGPAG